MKNDDNNTISDLIMDSIRLLILISKFEYRKTFKLTIDRIMLYDFIMKFPDTIDEVEESESNRIDFREYYSYYHWKPNQSEYIKILNYLISKGLVVREIEKKKFHYLPTDEGKNFVDSLHSEYKNELDKVAIYVRKRISKLSDTKVEDKILEKIDINNRFKGD